MSASPEPSASREALAPDADKARVASPEADELHPADAAWVARKSAVAPLVLGTLSILLSPILLGLFFGPLGMRSGIDLYRRGMRTPATVLAIGTGLVGIVLSVGLALVWGSILASVLLGRDAMRAAEGWRGREVPVAMVEALAADGATEIDLSQPVAGAPRHAILVVGVGWEPCAAAIRSVSEAADEFPDVPIVVVDRAASPEELRDFARMHGTAAVERFLFVGRAETLPPPLDQAAALPTLIVIGGNRAVEHAIVGAHAREDLEKLLRGDAAKPAAGKGVR